MPASSMPFEGPQEPSQSPYENDRPTRVSLATLPEDLNLHDNVGIQQHHPNFFLLASSSHTQATSAQAGEKTPQGNRYNGEEKQETQVITTALDILDILAHPKTAAKLLLLRKSPAMPDQLRTTESRYTPAEKPHTSTVALVETGRRTVEANLLKNKIPRGLEMIIIVLGLAVTFAAHAINMFYYPQYDLDEGTYMMSAWAITHGMIEPYAYGYGHPPLAWIQIAAWVKLTGGFLPLGMP